MKHWLILFVWGVAGCSPSAPSSPEVKPALQASPAVPVAPALDVAETGFSLIPFTGMAVFPTDGTADQTWTVDGEEFLCTGKPKCYLHTKTSFGDGTLRFDYRFEPDPKVTDPVKLAAHNTGVLLFIQEPHAIWPKSIEVQGKHIEMGQLRPNGTKAEVEQLKVVYQDHPEVRESARKPVGEWNSIEIVTKSGAITVSINGQVVAVGEPGELKSGLIGLQAEGHRLRYRRLRFTPAPAP
jgi:Domain of Unknown Function (DUF1080)